MSKFIKINSFFVKKGVKAAIVVACVLVLSALTCGYLFVLRNVKAEFYNEDGTLNSIQSVKP